MAETRFAPWLALAFIALIPVSLSAQQIAVILDGPVDAHAAVMDSLRSELSATGTPIISITERLLDLTERQAASAIASAGRNASLDAVIAIGSASARALSEASLQSVPTIGVFYGAPGARFSRGLSRTIIVDVNAAEEIVSAEEDLPITISSVLVDERISHTVSASEIAGKPVVPFAIDEPLASLGPGQAVYVMPLPHVSPREEEELFANLAAARVVAIASDGLDAVNLGAFAGYKSELARRIARELALLVDELSFGTTVAADTSTISTVSRLYINTETLVALRLSLAWDLVLEAEFIGTQILVPQLPQLAWVIDEALAANTDLASQRITAATQRIIAEFATGPLLPSIDGNARLIAIDEDRAEGSGSPYQYEGAIAARIDQLVWSEQAWTNLRVQELLSDAQDLALLSRRSDTALSAAEAYYELVRAAGFVRISRNAVERTQANLDRARFQERVGEESLANVLRFESQLAQDNQTLLDAITGVRQATLSLSGVLGIEPGGRLDAQPFPNAPTGEGIFTIQEIEELMASANTIAGAFALEEFSVESALARSDTLAASEVTVRIRERERLSAERRLYSPTVSVFGEVEYTFFQGGEGGGSEIEIAPGVTLDTGSFSSADETDLSAGLVVSIPIFSGRERIGIIRQADANLEQARNDRLAATLGIQEYARFTATLLVSTYNKLEQSRTAGRLALRSLELVETSYSQGAATSTELLDAQNNAAIAAQQIATAEADLQIAWSRLLHATGWIDALVSQERADEFVAAFTNVLEFAR